MIGARTIVALVAHARSVPSIDREAFASILLELPEQPGRVIFRTCHRVELYALEDATPTAALAALPRGAVRLDGDAAVSHLVRVACALESAVFGENEVLHQLREAIQDRVGARALDPTLDRLFQLALRAGREARAHFAGPRRSLADVALDRILDVAAIAGSTEHRSVVVVGAGRMGRLAALAAARRGLRVVVVNRTPSRALDLAREVGGTTGTFEAGGTLPSTEKLAGVVIAIAGRWPLGASDLAALQREPATVVDLSSPPAIDASIAVALNRRYITVDEVAGPEHAAPERALARLERIVERARAEYEHWLLSRRATPAIRALSEFAEDIRRAEVDRLRRRLPTLDDGQLAMVDQMTQRLVSGMLHRPLSALGTGADPDFEPTVRRLFDL